MRDQEDTVDMDGLDRYAMAWRHGRLQSDMQEKRAFAELSEQYWSNRITSVLFDWLVPVDVDVELGIGYHKSELTSISNIDLCVDDIIVA